jgi:hypothetical protein
MMPEAVTPLTPEEREQKLAGIRSAIELPWHWKNAKEAVTFLLAELERVTVERDAERRGQRITAESTLKTFTDLRSERDAALAQVEYLTKNRDEWKRACEEAWDKGPKP